MERERSAFLLLGAMVGAVLAVAALPVIAPALELAFFAPDPKASWLLARSAGLVAFALVALSTILGLLLSGKLAKRWPGIAPVLALHEHAALVGLGFAVVHAVVLFGDRHASYDWLGQLALYTMVIVVGSFYVRRRIGQRVWRVLHFGAFAVFALALVHAISMGTDHGWVDLVYAIPGAIVVFLTVHRMLSEWGGGQHVSTSRSNVRHVRDVL